MKQILLTKNNQFISFSEEVSKLALNKSGSMKDILNSEMKNEKNVKENLVDLISKIGEKITLRRAAFINNDKYVNFSYTHLSIKKNIGKLGVLLSIKTSKPKKWNTRVRQTVGNANSSHFTISHR